MTTTSRTLRRWSSGFTVALFVGVILACGIREDEFACEDAVAHLQSCCPGFTANNIDCTYTEGQACETRSVYPEIDATQAACIRSESCASLREFGVCARVEALPLSTDWQNNAQLNEPDGAAIEAQNRTVCPRDAGSPRY